MFPLRDHNPTLRTPVVTYALIGLNVLVWVVVQGMGADPELPASVCRLGLIPGELLGRIPAGTTIPAGGGHACVIEATPGWFTPLTSMFLHGSWMHIIGNMWFLHVFGNNVEDSMGRVRFLLFYVLCGLAAAFAQVAADPSSGLPMVGASGAIGGVMGAYVMLYPRVRIDLLVFLFIFVTTVAVPAYLMLGYWFLLQLLGGWATAGSEQGGTAFWAHVGGFLAGVLLVVPFRQRALVEAHRQGAEYVRRWLGAGAR